MESTAISLRDELTKLKQVCLQKEKQYQHELRKREKEFEKLKDQLATVLKDIPLREQKSEVQYMQSGVSAREIDSVLEQVSVLEDEQSAMESEQQQNQYEAEMSPPRSAVIEMENYRMRQILAYTFGSLIQLFMELFSDVELDQSLLALLETNPVDWVEESLSQKMDEVIGLLRENFNNVAQHQARSILKENEETIAHLNSQFRKLNLSKRVVIDIFG